MSVKGGCLGSSTPSHETFLYSSQGSQNPGLKYRHPAVFCKKSCLVCLDQVCWAKEELQRRVSWKTCRTPALEAEAKLLMSNKTLDIIKITESFTMPFRSFFYFFLNLQFGPCVCLCFYFFLFSFLSLFCLGVIQCGTIPPFAAIRLVQGSPHSSLLRALLFSPSHARCGTVTDFNENLWRPFGNCHKFFAVLHHLRSTSST